MSIARAHVSSFRKPSSLPVSIWVPLLGLAWVFVNVLLMYLGYRTGYQATSGLLAGGIDGSILATIVLATLGEKLQAGTSGLLGGYGLNDAISKFKLTNQYFDWLHQHSENVLVALLGPEGPSHAAVQNEVLWIASTAAVVVLATLIVQLIRPARIRPASGS